MSTINKLSIRGIRSFGIEKDDEQKITFTSPLTIISGENGCGKTTVIECLKYALTGEVPPGSDRGKAFIHDPKVFKNMASLGQVKVKITDIQGNVKTCVRSMRMDTQKTGKTKFETLDSTIAIINATTGKKEDISKRCADTNSEMCQSMGVSKAIINNVIFCHQEDSNWPMDEAKKLKEKFDAIFGTTEYNKAIDKLIKFRKGYQETLKVCTNSKKFLEQTKNETEKRLHELEMLKEKHLKMQQKFEEYQNMLDPLEEKMKIVMEKEAKFGKLVAEKLVLQGSIDNYRQSADNLRGKIKNLMVADVEDLEEELRRFHQTHETNETELATLQVEHFELLEKQKISQEKLNELQLNSKTLIYKRQQEQELVSVRFNVMKETAEKLNITINDDWESQSVSIEDFNATLHRIGRAISDEEEHFANLKREEEKKELEAQCDIDELREEKTASETNLNSQRQRITKLNENRKNIQREISSIEASMPQLNKLTTQIETAERDFKCYQEENNIEEIDEQRCVLEIDKDELDLRIIALDKDIEYLQSVSKITSELELKERELLKDQNDFDRTKNKQASNLKYLFGDTSIDRNFKNNVQALNDKLKREVTEIKSALQESRMEGNRLQTEKTHLRNQQKSKKTELKDSQERIENECDGRDYLDVFTSQKDKVDKLNQQLAFKKSSESTYKQFIAEIDNNPSCPLCHKNLEHNDGDDLKSEIDEKIRNLPLEISDTETKFKLESRKFDRLNSLKSLYDNISKVENEVKQLKKELQCADTKYQDVMAKIEETECQLAEPESKLNSINATFLGDMCRLDDLLRNIASKSKDIADLKSKMSSEKMSSRTLNEAQAERRELNADFRTKSDLIKKLGHQINEYRAKIIQAREKINNMTSEKIKHQEKLQGLDRLKDQLKECEAEKLQQERKLKDDEHKLEPLKIKLNNAVAKKQKTREEGIKKIQRQQDLINYLIKQQTEIDRLNGEIENLTNMNLQIKIQEANEKVSSINARIKSIQNNLNSKYSEIERLKSEITNQEGNQRNLQDNLELRRIEANIRENEKKFQELKNTMGVLETKNVQREKKEITEKRADITGNRDTIRGQITESSSRITAAETELNLPKHKKSRINYMKACYEEATLKAAIDDLNRYRNALDYSLLKFHKDKMDHINRTLRELWNSIYKGNDIDYIMIKTDEDDAKPSSDKRRSYNYRVVQAKNCGSEIDMRGRCSAGQKVLASLIIRMALSETFSANCGILALDEPTTNLDHNNIRSLCDALNKIVEERDDGGSFMLIIITHDEEFVRALDRAEYHFKLSRDPRGKSVIEKRQNI